MKIADIMQGIADDSKEKQQGIEYAINFIKDREQLDRMSFINLEDHELLIKFYTVIEMFMIKGEPDKKALRILDKYLALRGSVGGFSMSKVVDMFKTDIEYNTEGLKSYLRE